jgi:phosphate acetyltransferase
VQAAVAARQQNVAEIILVGPKATVEAQLAIALAGAGKIEGIEIHDPATSPLKDAFAQKYHSLREHKGISLEESICAVREPHIYAALLVKTGLADGTLGGAVTTTGEIVRAAIQIIGPAPGAKLISSFFLMLFCESHHSRKGAHVFADSGLVVDPNAEEMAEIARVSARSFKGLTGQEPRVAMLSFSTHGSATHEGVSKVVTATNLVRNSNPDMIIDGEIQFDAAFVPDVAAAKAEGSPLSGAANVFIFPNLDSGNIAYKIAQRVGGAVAIGPILQGLAQPANDLSRGCSTEDILHMIAVTAAQCGASA